MKKVVIAMLLLLPLIIVASVLLATSVIAHEVYIAVEGIELNVNTDETMELGLSQGSFQLNATVYPTAARNREVEWSVENVVCFGDEIPNPVSIEDGLVTFSTYCAFDAVATTVEGRKTARCNFYIKCDEIKGLTFDAPASVRVGERRELTATPDPVDAEAYDVRWTSSDESVLEIDGNGILRGVSPGSAKVTASFGEYVCEKTISVQPSVTKYGTSFSTAKAVLSFTELGITEATALSGATVDGETIALSAGQNDLTIGGETVIIHLVDDGIEIRNGDLLAARTYYVGKAPLHVEAAYKDALRAEKPQADVTVTGRATEANGVVAFPAKGEYKVTVSSSAGSQEVTFSVVQPVAYVRLDTVDADDKRGIAEQTVYGAQEYASSGLTGYAIPVRIQYPSEADWEDFELTVSHPDLLEIGEDRVVRVKKVVDEPTVVTVSVAAKYSQFASVPARANRHFLLINGVNCSTYADVVRASSEGRAVALRSNVASGENDPFIELRNDFYGNGYMMDFTATEKESEQPTARILADDVLVSNAYIRCDDGVKINAANGLSGAALWVGSDTAEYAEDYAFLTGVRVEYSVFENCYYCAASTRAEVTFDGCIFRNASNFGIHIINDKRVAQDRSGGRKTVYIYSDVTLNNSIVSNVIAPAVGISTFASESNGSALKTQSTFRQTGFFDVYNWQDITSDTMLGREFLPDNPEANSLFRQLISSFMSDELSKSKYDAICAHTEENNYYIHLGVITAGAVNECTTVPTFEDERIKTFPLTILESKVVSNMTNLFIGHPLYRINVYLYEVDADITYETKFVADKAAFAKLRGE